MTLPLRALTRWVLLVAAAAALPGGRAAAQAAPSPLADDPTLIALAVSLACAHGPEGGEGFTPPDPSPPPAVHGPELELVATVRAKAIRFDEVPHIDVKFKGTGKRRTTWRTERVNLPMHPDPGVTYRDVAVRLIVTSTAEELGDLLAQAKHIARGIRIERDDAVVPAAANAPAAVMPAAPAPPARPVPPAAPAPAASH
ncbi:MAG TPA: hypothetical protein VFP65_02060 [Anaeromyxobacteraceae bacterium]|nr:hypothetical protein [Anaeromyxobacteraceae bacterium]